MWDQNGHSSRVWPGMMLKQSLWGQYISLLKLGNAAWVLKTGQLHIFVSLK